LASALNPVPSRFKVAVNFASGVDAAKYSSNNFLLSTGVRLAFFSNLLTVAITSRYESGSLKSTQPAGRSFWDQENFWYKTWNGVGW